MSSSEILNIVIPMAGHGSRFVEAGYTVPKPLIDIASRSMIEWVIDNLRPEREFRFIFLVLEDHLRHFPQLQDLLENSCMDPVVIPVNEVTEGPACTALIAREYIDSEAPLMIANCDQYVEVDINDYLRIYEEDGVDGFIMTFHSEDPKWSFCKMRPDGTVETVVEKEVVSDIATVGIYNFSRGQDFVSAADAMIAANKRVNGEFYIAPVFNELIEKGARITTYGVGSESSGMHGLGTPEDLEKFKTTSLFKEWSRRRLDYGHVR